MLEYFQENSFPLIFFGLPVAVGLGVAWLLFKKPGFLYSSIAAFVILIGLVAFERLSVTDRERLDQIIYVLADCVRANDLDGVLEHVSRENPYIYDRVNKEMPDYKFRSCNIIQRQSLEVDSKRNPPRAKITFQVYVDVDASIRQGVNNAVGQGIVSLDFEKEKDGNWRIVDYKHFGSPYQ